MLAALPPAHPAVLGTEQELLEIFADIAALSRRVPEEDAEEEHARSSQEYMLTYLSFLDPERSGAPDHFLKQLRAALARYGVHTLKRTPELERALLRVYCSVSRMPAAAPIVIAILDSWRRAGDDLAPAMTGDRLAVLDRLIQTTQGRQQEVCDLAREVRFQYVDAPLLKASRAQAYAGIAACVSELSGRPSPQRRRELTDRLIWFPLPMRALLRDSYRAADTATRARLLEVRTRRYYRIRELTGLRCQKLGQHLTCLADYANSAAGGEPAHLVSAYVPLAELPDLRPRGSTAPAQPPARTADCRGHRLVAQRAVQHRGGDGPRTGRPAGPCPVRP